MICREMDWGQGYHIGTAGGRGTLTSSTFGLHSSRMMKKRSKRLMIGAETATFAFKVLDLHRHAGEFRAREDEGSRPIVSAEDGVSGSKNGSASIESRLDPCLCDGDRLLLHCFVNGNLICGVHLEESERGEKGGEEDGGPCRTHRCSRWRCRRASEPQPRYRTPLSHWRALLRHEHEQDGIITCPSPHWRSNPQLRMPCLPEMR
jgi:hypothetical protein